MIYTSYFANMKNIPQGYKPVAICAKSPDWYTGPEYRKLAPSYDIFMQFKQSGDFNRFAQRYSTEILGKLKPNDVVQEIIRMAEGQNLVLLCYEKPSDPCHRHLVADWLTKAGMLTKEL